MAVVTDGDLVMKWSVLDCLFKGMVGSWLLEKKRKISEILGGGLAEFRRNSSDFMETINNKKYFLNSKKLKITPNQRARRNGIDGLHGG